MVKPTLILLFGLIPLLVSALAGEKTRPEANRLPLEAIESLGAGGEFVLYSLDPGPITFLPQPALKPEESLDGFEILGRLPLTEPKSRSVALTAVTDAIRGANFYLAAMCFRPRHALRVTSHGKVFDFIICHECGRLKVYRDEVAFGEIGIPSAPEPLNKMLSDAGIPLAKVEAVK